MYPRGHTSLALAALLVLAGCLGGGFGPRADPSNSTSAEPTTAEPVTTTAAATKTARSPCSLDADVTLSNVSEPGNLSTETARRVAEAVESRYQSARVDEHSYFNYRVRSGIEIERVEEGYRIVLQAELDYDRRGSENATVVHVHRPYTVTYLVTDRKVVRRGEAGTTGTVVCW